MTIYGAIVYTIVALWLAPGSLWRPVALVLLLQWGIGEAVYTVTGDHISLPVYIVGDCAVIAVAFLWRSHWSDWLIISAYPLVWALYVQTETRDQWLCLYWIAVAQMIVAGPWPQIQKIWGQVSHGRLRPEAKGEGA